MKLHKLSILLLGLALVGAACGSNGEDAAEAAPLIVVEGSQDADTNIDADATTSEGADEQTDEELALSFAQCMRDEGVDLADPIVNADGSIELFRPGANSDIDPNDQAVTDAFDVCGDLIEGASFLPGAGLDQAELEDTLLEFTQCLRDLGFNVDDPDLSGGLAGGPAAIFGDSFDPTDPANADAVQECQAAFGAGGPVEGDN
ncbi:MAG: hypothetical protein HKN01_11395 [Acidimicrobiia bacterium]|nr:hypothetical protein [Acidimicrobiia bacterium]